MRVLILTAIYPTAENPAFGSFVRTQAESLRRAGVGIEVLVLRGRFRKLIYPQGVFQLRRRISADSIDLVHAHYSYVGMVARTQGKVPVVVTYHGDDLLGTINEKGEHTRFSPLIVAAGRMLASHVDAAIVQTREMARRLEKSNVFVIPHEVDFDLFRPTPKEEARKTLGLEPGKKYLLFAADPRIPVKRFPLAAAVAGHLAAQVPAIELLAVSRATQERLALYMSACDVLVFPSYQEGSPNIVKQAMACNLPIVATDVGDVREVIGQTPGCCVCEPSVSEFAARIKEILACGMRTNGREHIRHLESSVVAERVIQVYQQVLKNREEPAAERTGAGLIAFRK